MRHHSSILEWLWLGAVAGLVLAAGGCRTAPEAPPLTRFEFSSPHMGTLWRITLYAPDAAAASNAVRAAFGRVRELDQCMSDYDPESELERLRKSPPGVPVNVSDDLFSCLQSAVAIARETRGAFDPTVGLEVQLWRQARRRHALPDPARLAVARESVGCHRLRLDARTKTVTLLGTNLWLDLGGIAKGFGADAALAVLRRRGLPRALVAASGDLAIGDPPPGQCGWRVGIGAVGGRTNELAHVLILRNAAVSTSGDAEQFFELEGVRYSHIVNPRTGLGLTNRVQATIVAPCATRSDALATAVCVMGAERGLKFIERDGRCAAFILLPKDGARPPALQSRRFLQLEKAPPGGREGAVPLLF
ncbi:MAG: FAD:protein FMN transferase [Verrucomicrobia bacterium]|nr:FAD:protein FMN transferase [Verrucomicrobiota bacterium]